MAKKNSQHEAAGIDSEIKDLFSVEDSDVDDNPFALPAVRNHAQPPVKTELRDTADDEKIDKDVEYARNNIYELIEHGMAAVQDLSHIAREQMHPRAYEVLANLISGLTKNNLDLIELAKIKKIAKKKDPDVPENSLGPVNNIDKAIFLGSSHDLLQYLKKAEDDKATT